MVTKEFIKKALQKLNAWLTFKVLNIGLGGKSISDDARAHRL